MDKYLIVVDMQNDFIDGSLGTKEAQGIVDNVVKRIQEARENGEHVIFTMDQHFDDYLRSHEGKLLPVEHCIAGTDGEKLNEHVAECFNNATDVLFYKSSFMANTLPDYLHSIQDEKCLADEDMSFEVIGLCTDICVISNALLLRSAFPESDVSVRASCCAGVTPELHEAALKVMKSCQIDIIE